MRTEHEHGGHDFLYGLMAGAAIGAAIGLLLAPKTGAELRRQLGESAERFRKQADETYRRAATAVDDLVGQGRRAAQAGREKFDEARSQFAGETLG